MREEYLSQSEAAKRLGVPARTLPDMFYKGHPCDQHFVVVAGRKLIPASAMPEIRCVLAKVRGRRPRPAVA
jgi:hypothetical protein